MKVETGGSGKGTIVSIPDLAGAQAVISFTYNDTPTSEVVRRVIGIERGCRINILLLQIGNYSIPLDLKQLEKVNDAVYVSTFPQTLPSEKNE